MLPHLMRVENTKKNNKKLNLINFMRHSEKKKDPSLETRDGKFRERRWRVFFNYFTAASWGQTRPNELEKSRTRQSKGNLHF